MKTSGGLVKPRIQPKQKILPVTTPQRIEKEVTKKRSWVSFQLPKNLSFWFSRQYQQRFVNQRDVFKWPNDAPHITVRWGFYTQDVNDIRRVLGSTKPFSVVQFTGPQIFALPDSDVLVCRVISPQLDRLYHTLGRVPCETTHPDYNPHVTVAYLRRGHGKFYQDHDFKIDPDRRFILRDLRFHNNKRSVQLNSPGQS